MFLLYRPYDFLSYWSWDSSLYRNPKNSNRVSAMLLGIYHQFSLYSKLDLFFGGRPSWIWMCLWVSKIKTYSIVEQHWFPLQCFTLELLHIPQNTQQFRPFRVIKQSIGQWLELGMLLFDPPHRVFEFSK